MSSGLNCPAGRCCSRWLMRRESGCDSTQLERTPYIRGVSVGAIVVESTQLYFAYGSNLFTARLQMKDRAPSAQWYATAKLTAHTLRFHKESKKDGSGKCDAHATGCETDTVHGVVFKISKGEIASLDRAEGCGYGYDKTWVDVETKHGGKRAFTYVANQTHIDEELLPFPWYKNYVVKGALEHKLPNQYVERLSEQAERPDPKPERQREHDEFVAKHS